MIRSFAQLALIRLSSGPVAALGITVALALSGCGGDDGGVDAQAADTGIDVRLVDGEIDGLTRDGSPDTQSDANSDAGGECQEITLGEWSARVDDVSARLDTTAQPDIFGVPHDFFVLFERYDIAPDVGTFRLGEGPDANFGTCRHCLYAGTPIALDKVYFAAEGTLEQRTDPYSLRFDISVSGLVLREAEVDLETRSSTFVPGGRCVRIQDFELKQAFPGSSWTCEVADFADGESCHCNCGDYDPDCGGGFIGDEPNPVVDCPDGTVCGSDPVTRLPLCIDSCDWESRMACSGGETCIFDDGGRGASICVDEPRRLSEALVGEECEAGGFQRYCAIEGGFALGYCDAHEICRSVCEDDSMCTLPGHSCRRFIGEEGLGYCGPPPPKDG